MIKDLKLTPAQWKILASAFSNMGQAVVLFSFAAFFVPKVVNLAEDFSKGFAVLTFVFGILFLMVGVIISKRGK